MAILKHIKSRNANYSNAIDYLLFQHDESTGKKIKDEMGRSLLRDEFYMDGLGAGVEDLREVLQADELRRTDHVPAGERLSGNSASIIAVSRQKN